jgi:hypothetical protein
MPVLASFCVLFAPAKGVAQPKISPCMFQKWMKQWDYDLFKLHKLTNGRPLAAIAQGIIRSHGLIEKLSIDEKVFAR